MKKAIFFVAVFSFLLSPLFSQEKSDKIDRKAVVQRHNIKSSDLHLQLPLGNGNFCVTVDGTGLQTFGGNIMSHDAWHSSPLPEGFKPEDVPATGTFQQGRCQPGKGDDALPEGFASLRQWMFDNPHVANLGRIRLMRPGGDGTSREIKPEEIKNLERELNLWTGIHRTRFELDGEYVIVHTAIRDDNSFVVRVASSLNLKGALEIALDFPYPTEQGGNWVGRFDQTDRHETDIETKSDSLLVVNRKADSLAYSVVAKSRYTKSISCDAATHRIVWRDSDVPCMDLKLSFRELQPSDISDAQAIDLSRDSYRLWSRFWQTGAFVDLSESTDPRWRELERRIVLSQYLMRCNTAGTWCSAECGLLTTDPWRSQFHMEMVWWHLAHYALWDRLELAGEALRCYEKHKPVARQLAEQLGYKGYKWGKSVGPEGRTAPWRGNQVLLWKQPHPIFFAELEYRNRPTKETLEKWADTLEGTAEHMADYVTKDENGVYHLDPSMPPSEVGISKDTVFDLAYWRWGLDTANRWRERLGKPRNEHWDTVRKNLAPLPTVDDPRDGTIYARSPEWLEEFTKRNWEHPDMAGVYGMLPPVDGVDPAVSKRTVEKMKRQWNWSKCWGWDFPWIAMSLVRNGLPEDAIDMLLHDSPRNRYDARGVNLGGPCPYLPGNGGLLYVIGMMCAGWDGGPEVNASGTAGFPANGWKVKHEGFKQSP